jgi:tetratricopeptide (TPR) repeat protein
MIIDSCSTEEDFTFIEKLASEELQESKARGEEYRVPEIVDILLDIYEKKKDEERFLLLCEKEFEHSYSRYIENLESKGKIDEAIQCCTRALDFAEGFLKTELIEKLGDLRHTCGDNDESLFLYIQAFKDSPEEELLEKITRLSNKLDLWKDVKEELTSFMVEKGDTHNLLEIYLRDKDLVSAFKIASQHINHTYDTERVRKHVKNRCHTRQQNSTGIWLKNP